LARLPFPVIYSNSLVSSSGWGRRVALQRQDADEALELLEFPTFG